MKQSPSYNTLPLHLITSLVLFILAFLYTQGHTFFPTSTFPIPFYILLFGSLGLHLWLSLSISIRTKQTQVNKIEKIQLGILLFLVIITLGRTIYSAINLRHELGPAYPVHDNPIQIEEGIKYLLQGKNPFLETYHGTPLEEWHGWKENPSLYHFITPAFYPIFSILVYLPSQIVFGFFDERMVHVLLLLVSLTYLYKLIPSFLQKNLYLTLFIFNPLFIHFFIEGRNDIVVFTWILLSLFYLARGRIRLASLFFGFAFATKQQAWLMLPFFFAYIFWSLKGTSWKMKLKSILKKTWPFFATTVLFFIPFLVWDATSFIQDIYLYPAGNLQTSLEIKGFGFTEALRALGFIYHRQGSYPILLWEFLIGIPTLIFLLIKLKANHSISFLIFSYAIFLCVFWYFSRFFVDNYVGYLSMLLIAGIIFREKEILQPQKN